MKDDYINIKVWKFIILLNMLDKVLEIIITAKINEFIEMKNLFSTRQMDIK